MEAMIKEYLKSFIRTLLAPVVIYLTESGYVSSSDAVNLGLVIASIAVTVIWSLANKFLWKKTVEGAVQLPATTSSSKINDVINYSGDLSKV